MKKHMLWILELGFVVLLAGCTSQTTNTTAEKPIVYQVLSLDNPFNVALCITEDPKTSMGINFELMSDQSGFVEYWEKGRVEKNRITAEKKVTDVDGTDCYLFEATIENLIPGTAYEYRVFGEDDTKSSAVRSFTTELDSATESTFMVLTDPQGSDVFDYMTYASNVLNIMDVADQQMAFALFTGDLVNVDESRTQWNLFLKYSSAFSLEIPLAATNGNHETGSFFEDQIQMIEFQGYLNFPENGPLYQPFDELAGDRRTPDFDLGKTYSFDYGFAHYVAIDS